MTTFIHDTATIEPNVTIGKECKIWHYSHLREGVTLEDSVSLGKGTYIDPHILISKGTRIQNGVSIYKGVNLAAWCFVGPHVVFTNDRSPRSGKKEWLVEQTIVETGASIGAGTIIKSGITIGAFSLIGAGSIILNDLPPFAIARGNPILVCGYTCVCGDSRFEDDSQGKIQDCCVQSLSKDFLENAKDYLSK